MIFSKYLTYIECAGKQCPKTPTLRASPGPWAQIVPAISKQRGLRRLWRRHHSPGEAVRRPGYPVVPPTNPPASCQTAVTLEPQ